jgi:prepilin-type N-terminal cleavage/methylation domain-containing protein
MKSKSLRGSRKSQSGFTLVEIAIVLVIIGLLLGGVLKGQELIENAKTRSIRNDYQGIAAAHYAYLDRYNQLAGDDNKSATRFGLTASTATTVGNGSLNAVFNASCANINTEECQYWSDLRASGLLTGTGFNNPTNAFGGVVAIVSETAGSVAIAKGLNLCMGNLPAKAAEAIDAAFDDGVRNTGNVRATLIGSNGAPSDANASATYVDGNGSNQYTVCKIL